MSAHCKPVGQEMFSDEHLRALEKQFIEKYKGNEKHPIRRCFPFIRAITASRRAVGVWNTAPMTN